MNLPLGFALAWTSLVRIARIGRTALYFGASATSIAACSIDAPADVAPQPTPPVVPPAPDAGRTADAADAAPPKVLPKPTFPEVQSRGGPVIKTPRVLPIVFKNDPLAAQITDFTTKIAASQYWKDVGLEYGVGAMTTATTIVLDEAPPTTIASSAIETWLAGKLTGATPAFGAPDANTLYAIYYPSGTTITLAGSGEQGQSCAGYGGYHFEVDAGGTQVGYAVLPRCSVIEELTVAASHEYFEWATDPFPRTKPAYNRLDDAHWAWQAAFLGELGDLCTFLDRANLNPPEIGFEIQRQWSNKLSLAGKYPCAPTKTAPYLQAIPIAEDDALVPDYGNGKFPKNIKTKAVRIKPGGSKTVDVLIYSDQGGSQSVPLRAMSYKQFYGGKGENAGFSYMLDESYGEVGKSVAVTITAPATPSYDLLMMLAYTSKTSANYWPILVVNDDAADVAAGVASILPAALPKKPTRNATHAFGGVPFTTLGMRRSALANR